MRKTRVTSSLISAVMILVLTIVALSTATYAWFSADNVVGLSSISFEVVNKKDGDGDLRLEWDFDGGGTLPVAKEDIYTEEGRAALAGKTTLPARSLSMQKMNGGYWTEVQPENDWEKAVLSPAMPSIAPRKGMSVNEFIDSLYSCNTSYRIDNGKIVEYYYSEPNQDNVAAVCSRGNGWAHRDIFYVYNMNEAFGQRVSISFNIEGNEDIKKAFRCAVFQTGPGGGLQCILGASDRIYYGPIVKDANISENLNYVNRTLTYDSANPEVDPDMEPGAYASPTGPYSAPFSFDVYDVIGLSLYFYLDGNYITNQASSSYSFDVVDFKLVGEFIERPATDTTTP